MERSAVIDRDIVTNDPLVLLDRSGAVAFMLFMIDTVKSGAAHPSARDSLALRAAHADGLVVADAVTLPAELGMVCRKDRVKDPTITPMGIDSEVWRSEGH